jgi:hypothetical protein
MDVTIIRNFFLWCTIINGALLIFSALLCAFAGGWIYRMHSIWFNLPREAFNIVIYSFVGFYKVIFIVFNLIPFLALAIVG